MLQIIGAVYKHSDPTDIAVTAAGGLSRRSSSSMETKIT